MFIPFHKLKTYYNNPVVTRCVDKYQVRGYLEEKGLAYLLPDFIGGAYEKAEENRKTAAAAERTTFVQANAEQFPVPEEVDRIYFFNPFSLEILQKAIRRIQESYYARPREMFLFFYYPSDEYISYLMTVDELMFSDEIDCGDLFEGKDSRERIVIFELRSQ